MIICAQCGHENPETNKFCGECAAPLTAATKHGPEVRKTVTVLFCDLTSSTELGEALDPERLRALLARYFEWPVLASSARLPCRICSRGSTRTSHP